MKQKAGQGILFVLAVLVLVFGGANKTTVKAEAAIESTEYIIGNTVNSALTESGDAQKYFKFTLSQSGAIHVSGTAFIKWINLYLYDENLNELWSDNMQSGNTDGKIEISPEIYLASGTYYLCFERDGNEYGDFHFKIDFTSIRESFPETNGGSNNSFVASSAVSTAGIPYNAQLAVNDGWDFWKFTLSKSGTVNFNAVFYNMDWVYWVLYDVNGKVIKAYNPNADSVTGNITVNQGLTLSKGTYYIVVSPDDNRYGQYTFSLLFTASASADNGTNTSTGNASASATGSTGAKTTAQTLNQTKISTAHSYGKKTALYIRWAAVKGATGYQIRYSKNKTFKTGVKTINIKGQAKYAKTISKLSRKKKYYVQVRAYKKSGTKTTYGKWSTRKCLKTK